MATTPDFASSSFAAFWDVDGNNEELSPVPLPPEITCFRTYTFNLPALDTGLFLLLPDVREAEVVAERDTEIRGYVRLSVPSASPVGDLGNMRTLLLLIEREIENIESARKNSDRQIKKLLLSNQSDRQVDYVSSKRLILDQPSIFLAPEIYGTEKGL